ncbi:MAG: DUF3021 domain-containing protein [Oscillospiraceae bacterium]|nr:DUF3021 domain-containing protein [Oscillospiraceae bacterium]
MKKKLMIRSAIGFVIGMVLVVLIPAIFNRGSDGTVHICSDTLIARAGSPTAALLVSLLLYGLYGACCMAGTVLYEIESWSLARATAVHYLGVMLGYVIADLALGWRMPLKELLLIETFMTVSFFLIWLILYLRYRAMVKDLNTMQKDYNKRHTEGAEET